MVDFSTALNQLIPIIVITAVLILGAMLILRGMNNASSNSDSAPPVVLDPETAANDAEFLNHLENNRKINAIKRYRELTGIGLKEAKDSVEYFQKNPEALLNKRTNRLNSETASGTPFDAGIRELIKQNKSHEAIKVYQEFTGAGLSEAAVEIERLTLEIEEQEKRFSGVSG
jgi:ribosomal protein L7/L12